MRTTLNETLIIDLQETLALDEHTYLIPVKYQANAALQGLDFSMDYVDSRGNSMELLHFEYDSYNFNEIRDVKRIVEETLTRIDWDLVAQILLEKKHEWIDLEFFEQSKYKTDFFGLPAERFKQNAWE